MNQPSPTRHDVDAFAALVARHTTFLFRVAYAQCGHRQDAEDAVQETLLKLYRTGLWRQPMLDERAYLARAVWRAALDRQTTADARHLRHAEDPSELMLASAAPGPEEEMLRTSDRALLRRLLAQLPDELRHPLLLSAVDGLSGREVAGILHLAEPTVRTRIHRAKARLRELFAREAAVPTEVRR